MSDELDLIEDDDGNLEHTYLTFRVGDEEYAVPVAMVTEIVRLPRAFALPDVPSYVRGVINLRGKVIPLLDVRSRFGLPDAAYDDRTVVVVLELGALSTGLIVDAVSEVAELLPDQVEPRAVRSGGGQTLVSGVGKRANGVTFILNVEALLDVRTAGATDQLIQGGA